MKIIRASEVKEESRSYGRKVKKMVEFKFDEPVDSFVLYYGESPEGKLDAHYHTSSHELISFPIGGKIKVNGELFIMEKWDAVLLDPGDIHEYEEEDGSETIHYAIKFPATPDKTPVKKK